MAKMRGPFTVNGRQVWLSDLQRDLLMKMRASGVAARDEQGRLILECADGSSKRCDCNPQAVRAQIVGLEGYGLLVSDVSQCWSLTDHGRRIRATLIQL